MQAEINGRICGEIAAPARRSAAGNEIAAPAQRSAAGNEIAALRGAQRRA
ncbi:MAG: hypothetical protein KIT31_22335 [Deltaproteobacteria bacterium]|nr:hypothetical protein [Deltaproteobacteria bacterium]